MSDNALTKTLDAASDSGTRDAVSHSIAFIVFAARGGAVARQRTKDKRHLPSRSGRGRERHRV